MFEDSIQNIIRQIEQLPLKEQFEVTARLQKRIVEVAKDISRGRMIGPSSQRDDPEPDHQWLRENHRHYVNQWVALKDGRLIAHGLEAKEVFAAAKAQGIKLPLVFFIEDNEVPTLPGL